MTHVEQVNNGPVVELREHLKFQHGSRWSASMNKAQLKREHAAYHEKLEARKEHHRDLERRLRSAMRRQARKNLPDDSD